MPKVRRARSFTSRITWLITSWSIALGVVVSLYLLINKYQASTEKLGYEFEQFVVATDYKRQLAMHYRDKVALEEIISKAFQNLPILYMLVYDTQKKVVAKKTGEQYSGLQPPILTNLRQDAEQYKPSRSLRMDSATGEFVIDITIPFFSIVSPLAENIKPAEFVNKLFNLDEIGSLHLQGYVHFGVNINVLKADFILFAQYMLAVFLLFILVVNVLSLIMIRRLTAPLVNLGKMAEDITFGKLNKMSFKGVSSEVRQISTMLNAIIDGLVSHKTNLDVDNRLLSMKVDERTTELSVRNVELNKAIEEVTQTKNRLRKLAYFDTLTNLPNRRYFTEQFELLLNITRREKKMLAFLFIDIDNFKRINDSLGHNAGDMLLKEVAFRLKNIVRDSDLLAIKDSAFVSRFGGDEFTIILTNIEHVDAAGLVASRLLEGLSMPMTVEGQEFVVTPSIGISLFPQDGDSLQLLLKHADTAMYVAKAEGKNSYLYYTENMDEADVERLQMETELRKALEKNELELHYQPQININTGMVEGAEVLLRWKHAELGYIPPFEFVGLAEKAGIIGEIGDWVLFNACIQMKAIRQKGLELPQVSINVSSLQFTDNFVHKLRKVLHETGLDPKSIVIEITEGIIMGNASELVSRLEEIKRVGVGLSVDDFGTGYSSLSYLTRFPLSELKIDRCFISNVDKSPDNASIVGAIISMGESLGLSLVAEGAETLEECVFLKQHGIQVVQGYFFSKPLDILEFEALLKRPNFQDKVDRVSNLA